MMQLYYSPGACSLGVHIALAASGSQYQLIDTKISDGKTRTEEFLRLNDRARVPVLVRDGHPYREAAAILVSLADWYPAARLLPTPGSLERHEALEWLLFCAATIHPLYWGLWRKHRLVSQDSHHADLEVTSRQQLISAYQRMEDQLQGRKFLIGATPFACDYYAFVFIRWAHREFSELQQFPRLAAYYSALAGLPAVQAACTAEELALAA